MMGGMPCRENHLSERRESESGREGASSERKRNRDRGHRWLPNPPHNKPTSAPPSCQNIWYLERALQSSHTAKSQVNKVKPNVWYKKAATETLLQFELVGENFPDLHQPGDFHLHCGSLNQRDRHTNTHTHSTTQVCRFDLCVILCSRTSNRSDTWTM